MKSDPKRSHRGQFWHSNAGVTHTPCSDSDKNLHRASSHIVLAQKKKVFFFFNILSVTPAFKVKNSWFQAKSRFCFRKNHQNDRKKSKKKNMFFDFSKFHPRVFLWCPEHVYMQSSSLKIIFEASKNSSKTTRGPPPSPKNVFKNHENWTKIHIFWEIVSFCFLNRFCFPDIHWKGPNPINSSEFLRMRQSNVRLLE